MNEFDGASTADVIYDVFIGVSPVFLVAGAVLLMFLPTANTYFSTTKRTDQQAT